LNLQLIPVGQLFTGVNWHNGIACITETVPKQLEADVNFKYTSSGHGFPHGTSRLNLWASNILSEIWASIKSVKLFQACLSTLLAL